MIRNLLESYIISLVSQVVDRLKREFGENLLGVILENFDENNLRVAVILESYERSLEPIKSRVQSALNFNPFKLVKVKTDILVFEDIFNNLSKAILFLYYSNGTIVYDKDFIISKIINGLENDTHDDILSILETANRCLEDAENAIGENDLVKAIYKASLTIDLSLRALSEIAEIYGDILDDILEIEYDLMPTPGDLFENPLIRETLSYRSSVLELVDRAKKTLGILENIISHTVKHYT
ncbi:MAG: hypothetical protein DRN04_04670 [Thermoprotei archaeon]|nr:MAG: hypothetical protein DRN04_04670 [Thermoprotei archaeon]